MLDSNSIVVLIVVFIGLLSLKLVLSRRGGKLKLPPSPPRLPIIGNLHQLGRLPHRTIQALSKKYGPVMLLHLGHSPTLVISSDQAASEMFKDHDIIFSNRPFQTATNILVHADKDLAFAPYGHYWRQIRKACVVELLSVKRVQSFSYVREEEVALLIKKISKKSSSGVPINISKYLLSLTNNISCSCFLGRKFEGSDKHKFAELSKKVTLHLLEFSFGDFFPSLGWMDVCSGLIARIKKTSQDLDAFIGQVIEEHKNQLNDADQLYKIDFIHILLKLQKDDVFDFEFTKDYIIGIVMNMIVAGTDTTFVTMEWAISELMRHPNIMHKVQQEVRNVVGTKSKMDENDISQMKYLKCVLRETLRLHPPAPLSVPRETSSCAKIGNYDIPPKTRVLVNLWGIQRDSRIWNRPEEFLPERFENYPIDSKGQDFNYIPFGGGRRGCPGTAFATAIAEYALANLLYSFSWKLPGNITEKELDMSEGFGVTTPRKMPLFLVPSEYSP